MHANYEDLEREVEKQGKERCVGKMRLHFCEETLVITQCDRIPSSKINEDIAISLITCFSLYF